MFSQWEECVMEKPKFSGTISKVFDEDDKYSFYYDGKRLNLHLVETNGLKIGCSKKEDFLLANHSAGGIVGLYKCVCNNNTIDETATIYPSMIYVSKCINSTDDKFNRLLFKGKIVNQLFPPTKKVKYDSSKDFSRKRDGSKIIELKTFDDTDLGFSVAIDEVLYNCKFGVYCPGAINDGDDNLGELTSYFEIDFEETKYISDVLKVYLAVRRFFEFLAKQKDIYFDGVQVDIKNNDGKFETIGFFSDNTIEEHEIKIKFNINKFLPHIGDLFLEIAKNEFNYKYIPKDDFEAKYITSESYMKVCGAFEHNYELIFTTLPSKYKYKLDTIDSIKEFLDEKLKAEGLSNKYKQYFDDIVELLINSLNSVEAQFNRCLSHYISSIDDFLQHVKNRYGLQEDVNLGREFSQFRNIDVHGGFVEFTNSSICAFVVCVVMIECMILEESNYTLEEIKDIIAERYPL